MALPRFHMRGIPTPSGPPDVCGPTIRLPILVSTILLVEEVSRVSSACSAGYLAVDPFYSLRLLAQSRTRLAGTGLKSLTSTPTLNCRSRYFQASCTCPHTKGSP